MIKTIYHMEYSATIFVDNETNALSRFTNTNKNYLLIRLCLYLQDIFLS